MSAPATADDLITLVRKSGLLDEAKINSFLQAHQKDGLLRGDARTLSAALIRAGLITNFHAEQFLLGKWKGFTLGKFKLLERIGFGAMGQVFLCEHRFMRKRMAVKVLPPTKAEDPVALGRFYREARVASGLEHVNIVRTYDIDQDGPLHFLVMEYVDGTTLLDIVNKFGPLSAARAATYIRMAAKGLQFAHTQGMIHRDIKPGNIILDRSGVAKILDMGLARFSQDDKDQITVKYDDKNVLGSADYIAPEQTRDARNIDSRADIYGMGATFYFILTGQPPFPDGTVAEKIIAHQTKKPRPMREVRPDVPQGLAKVIEKMMAKDPNDRFQTAQEIVDVLEVWTQTPVSPPSAEEMPQLSPAATEPLHTGHAAHVAQTAAAAAAARDASQARADDSKNRLPAVPARRALDLTDSAFEAAATVPTPPARPAFPATASMVDLVLPPPKAASPVARLAPPAGPPATITPDRSPPAAPTVKTTLADTPRPTKVESPRPPSFPQLELPKLPPDLSRLTPSKMPGTTSRPQPGDTPKPLPRAETPRPGSVELPKTPPEELEITKPTPVPPLPPPAEPVRTFPSLRDALRGSAVPDLTKPPPRETPMAAPPPEPPRPAGPIAPLSGSRDAARSRPGPSVPLSKSRDMARARLPLSKQGARPNPAPAPALPEATPPPAAARGSKSPVYRPPTLMPFFDQPALPPQYSFASRVARWTLMMMISTAIGTLMGAAIWYQFMRT